MKVTMPMDGRSNRISSTFLIRSTNPVMVGHQVHGFKVLPGLSYIDLIYQFFHRQGHAFAELELRNLAIHRPMVLPGDDDILIEIQAVEIRPGAWQLFIDGTRQQDGRAIGEQARYAVGEMHRSPVRFDDSEHMLERPAPRLWLETDSIYAAFRQRGLVHSGFMQVHGLGFSTATHAFADVSLGDEAKASVTKYMFHPALLDGAVTCASGMLPGAESEGDRLGSDDGRLYIPLSYDTFRVSALIRDSCIARIDHNTLRRRNDLFLITVDFLDGKGRKVGELKNLALKALRHNDAIKESSDATGAGSSTIASFKSTAPVTAASPAADAPVVPSTSAADPQTMLRELIASAIAARIDVPSDRVDPDVGYYEMGLDSVGLLQLVTLIESRLGVSLSPTLLFEYTTINELVERLAELHDDALVRLSTGPVGGTVPVDIVASGEPPQGAAAAPRTPSQAPVVVETDRDIAIIGMAARLPMARNIRELWRNLEEGRDCISEVPPERWDWHAFAGMKSLTGHEVSRWGGFVADADCFDARFFRVTPRAAEIIDPQERLFLEVSWEAIEDAGYTPKTLAQPRAEFKRRAVGVFAGVMHKDYLLWQAQKMFDGQVQPLSMSNAPIANRVSYFCNFHGPSIVVDTLCSSSLTAVHMAAESLRFGVCEVALAGGVNLSLHPGRYLTFAMLGMHSSDGRCRTFGADGDGYVAGEGVGTVVLKPLARAVADGDHVYAVIKASAANHVGTVSGISVPSPVSQADLIAGCLAHANIDARTISCVEAHGTGTSLGDPIEIEGLSKAFQLDTDAVNYCAIGSIKSNIGHAESAAGIAGLIKLALQLQHKRLVPSLHCDAPNPHIRWERTPFVVQTRAADWQRPRETIDGRVVEHPRRGAVSSFGAAGSNAHVVLEEYDGMVPSTSAHGLPAIVPLSAQTEEQLRAYVERLADHLRSAEGAASDARRIAHTLQIGREAFDARVAFVVADADELLARFDAFLRGSANDDRCHVGNRKDSVGSDRPAADIMPSDAVRQHVADGRIDAIARRWAHGAAVDWQGLYPAGAPVRISLPTYPFAKDRYWIEGIAETQGVAFVRRRGAGSAAALHPLLHANTSNLDEQRYSTLLDGEAFYLRDHVVKDARVLPGVAFLEMAHAALKRATAASEIRYSLGNIVWVRPVVVGAEPVELHVSLFRAAGGALGYEIHSLDAAAERTVHFQGDAVPLAAAAERIDIDALQALCSVDLPVADCYRLLDSSGLSYGGSFQVMRSIRVGNGNDGVAFVLAKLDLPDSVRDGAERFDLHPSIVDGALQSSIGLLLTQGGAVPFDPAAMQPYLPYALERIEVFGPCNGDAYAIVRNAPGNSPRLRKLDVTICDAAGHVRARLHGFGARLLEKPVAAAAPAPAVPAKRDDQRALLTFAEEWYELPIREGASHVEGAVVCLLSEERHRDLFLDAVQTTAPGVRPLFVAQPDAPVAGADAVQDSAAAYAEAFVRLAQQSGPLDAIAALWPVADPAAIADYGRLVALLKGIAAANLPKLRLVLTAVCRTPLERACVDSWIAIVPSLKRLLPHQLQIVGVVVDPADDEDSDALTRAAVVCALDELRDPAARPVFHERGVRRAQRMVSTSRTSAPSILRNGATYLITGGLGGLGGQLAERLARAHCANLVLLGRSAPDAAARDTIASLESHGVRVRHAQVDVADAPALREAIAEAQAELGPIDGVFHVAGVAYSGAVFDTPYAEFERVLAPKIAGTLALDAAFADAAPGFVCYYASSSAVLGDFGACAYAIANRFQAAYARHAGGVARAIEWPLWRDGGLNMGDAAGTDLYLQSSGQRALETGEGLDLLEQLLAEPHPQQLVLAGMPGPLHQLLAGAGVEVPAHDAHAIRPASPLAANDPVAQRMLRYLRALLGEAIKMPVERVSPDTPLDEYGFDSILAMQMTNELEKSLGSLSKTLFFEHHDLQSLNSYLVENHRSAVLQLLGIGETAAGPAPAVVAPPLRQLREPSAAPRFGAAAECEPIAIVGIGGRFPRSADLDAFWDNLRAGTDCVAEVPTDRWDCDAHFDARRGTFGKHYCRWGGFLDSIDAFDPLFFNMTPLEAQFTDPQQRLFLETVWQLLESNGYTRTALQDDYAGRVGVYVGSMYNQYSDASSDIGSGAICTSPQGGIANRVSYFFGLQGPSIAVDTMCSSAFVAIHMACADLRQGACGLAIAGGVNLTIHPKKYITLSQAQMLASDARARSFGVADGYLPAEGVGAVLLKPLQRALDDGDAILATIKGSALNHNGRSNGYSVPNPVAQAQVIEDALRNARIAPGSIGYVEAAANGSPLGDAIEMVALRKVFAANPPQALPIGAVKSNIGHAEAASGIAQLAKVLLQMRHRELVPSIGADPPNPNIRFDDSPFRLQRDVAPWIADGLRCALINSFGAGGSNACLVVEEFVPTPDDASAGAGLDDRHVIVLSAKSFERLHALARSVADHIAAQPSLALADIAYTLQCGREAMACRFAVVVDSREALLAALAAHLANTDMPVAARVVAFVGGQAESASFESFTSGSAGQALLDTFVRERDVEKLAMFWAYGGKVPWMALHPRRRRVVPLPGYPFARDRFWLPGAGSVAPMAPVPPQSGVLPREVATFDVDGRRTVAVVHPLLHVNSSDFSECRFSTTFTGDEPYAARDAVRDLRLIPQAVFIEMLRAAVVALTGRPQPVRAAESVRLVDLRWSGSIEIKHAPVTVHVGLRAVGAGRLACELYSLADANDGASRIVHCRGTAVLGAEPMAQESIDLEALRGRSTNRITTAQWYEMLSHIGLEFAEAYGRTGTIRTGADERGAGFYLIEFDLPADAGTDDGSMVLPPLLLNTVLQAAALRLADVGDDVSAEATASIPTALVCRESAIPASLPSTVAIHVRGTSDGDRQSVDIDICDAGGALLARFAGIVAAVSSEASDGARVEVGRAPLLALAHRDIVAPRNEIESTLLGFWQEALGFSAIGVFDGFLSLGGNSLSAVRVVARIEEHYQVSIAVPALLVPESTIVHLSGLLVAELARQVADESTH